MRTAALTLALTLAACATPPSIPPESESGPGEDGPEVDVGTRERPQLTAAECEAQGGTVVGDIGDGAIHRPDYRCPDSGEAPLGSIVAEGEGPVAIEGAVCCR